MPLIVILIFAFGSALIGHNMAVSRGKNAPVWAIICFLFPLIGIVMLAISSDSQIESTKNSNVIDDSKWNSLALYDPDIKEAVERLKELGPSALLAFKSAYSHVQNKASIPLIVEDIETKARSSTGLIGALVEVHQGIEIHKDAENTYIVNGLKTSDLGTARSIARVAANRKL